jgi:RND family efflux transporter MFP subunit
LALEVLAARLGCRVRLGGLDSRRDSMNAQRNENDRARRDGGGDGAAPETAKPETPADAPPRPRRGLGRLFALLIAAGVALLLYNYWGVWEEWGWFKTTQQAPPALPPPAVTVAKPLLKELVEYREFTGQFEAVDYVDVRARVSGYLESINFVDGQIVKKGDLLFVIEPKPFELALQTAKADVAEANANLDLAKAQLERTAELRKKDYATAETYDERVAQVNTATAARDASLAALDQAQLNLDYTRVLAPIAGRASRHELSVGNLVIGGTTGTPTLLTTIVSLDPIHFFFNVSEADGMTYKRLVQKGEILDARGNKVQVEAQLMDEKDWPLRGNIDFVDNQYDQSTGTIRVRAAFPNPDYFITAGQFGRIRVPMSQLHEVMLVPDAAVVTDQSTKMLFAVMPDGTVVPKPVELGPVVDGNLRIVRSGVDANDQVIVSGLLRARPGQKVTPEQGTVEAAAMPTQPK